MLWQRRHFNEEFSVSQMQKGSQSLSFKSMCPLQSKECSIFEPIQQREYPQWPAQCSQISSGNMHCNPLTNILSEQPKGRSQTSLVNVYNDPLTNILLDVQSDLLTNVRSEHTNDLLTNTINRYPKWSPNKYPSEHPNWPSAWCYSPPLLLVQLQTKSCSSSSQYSTAHPGIRQLWITTHSKFQVYLAREVHDMRHKGRMTKRFQILTNIDFAVKFPRYLIWRGSRLEKQDLPAWLQG